MFGKGGMAGLMKQAQQMQENVQKAQAEVALLLIEGSAGGGMVKVTLAGDHSLKNIQIDPSVLDDKETLEDLILIAVNEANRKLAQVSEVIMAGASSGMNLPAGMKLPF